MSRVRVRRYFSSPFLIACLSLSSFGCDEGDDAPVTDCYLGAGLTTTSGTMSIDYDGFAGKAPSDGVPMFLGIQQAERLYFQGCRYDGQDLWWLDLDVELATTAERPAPFELLDPNAARITALISRCAGGDCASSRRSWFGGGPSEIVLEGTLDEFDPVSGRIDLDATLIDIAPRTLETAPFAITADLSWTPTYETQLTVALDGHFQLTSAGDEAEEVELRIELAQDGATLSGNVCTEDDEDECTGPAVSGAVADPTIRLAWVDEASSNPISYQVHATFSDEGDDFSGTLSSDDEAVRIDGERER